MTRQIVALGGGGFSRGSSTMLDDYILALARRPHPRICFVPTASGDNESYIVRFYRCFAGTPCEPTHLELFRRNVDDTSIRVNRCTSR
jgi:aminopeptidase N